MDYVQVFEGQGVEIVFRYGLTDKIFTLSSKEEKHWGTFLSVRCKKAEQTKTFPIQSIFAYYGAPPLSEIYGNKK